MKEQYKARNSIVAHFDQLRIDQNIKLVKALQQSRIGLERIEDLKAEVEDLKDTIEELDVQCVDTQMEILNDRDKFAHLTDRVRQLEISMIEKG